MKLLFLWLLIQPIALAGWSWAKQVNKGDGEGADVANFVMMICENYRKERKRG